MWLFSQLSVPELVFLFLILVLACCFGRHGWRWMKAVGPLALLGALIGGPDLMSMLIVIGILMTAFGLGVYWGPRLSSPNRMMTPSC